MNKPRKEKDFFDEGFDVDTFVKERIGTWRQVDSDHFPKTDDFTTIVIKAHLILEQHLTRLLSEYCRAPVCFEEARLSFRQKLELAKGFVFFPVDAVVWRALGLLNSIRNDIAHNLKSPRLEKHLAQARELIPDKTRAEKKTLKKDADVVTHLFGFCSGYLQPVSVLIAAVERSKNDSWKAELARQAKARSTKSTPDKASAA